MNTPKENKKMFRIIAGVTAAAAVLAGAAYFFSIRAGEAPATQPAALGTVVAPVAQTAATVRSVPDGQHEYRSAQYRFSLLYPQELSVAENQEGGGAMTVTFQDIATVQGFQIFIVPYTETQVSSAQFRKDIPSGVQEQLANIQVAGATGAAFYSTDALLGATREVWFIHGGYLYEVTTLRPLAPWLDQIMQTWQFI